MQRNKSKVFLCGTKLIPPHDEVVEKFRQAEEQINSFAREPINPLKNGLLPEDSFSKHLLADIQLLLECDAIYLLADWNERRGGRILEYIARELGLEVLEQPAYMGGQNT